MKLSPLFNFAMDINSIAANGGKIFTYANKSSTKQPTYTDSTGTTQNPNPIILNSRGEPPNGIWLTEGLSYTLVFTAATDTDPPTTPIVVYDNITGVGDNTVSLDQWVSTGTTPTFINANTFTISGDQTSTFQVNRRVKLPVTAGTVYGYISSAVFTTLTTVMVILDSGNLDSGLSSVSLGLITPINTSSPNLTDSSFSISKLASLAIKAFFSLTNLTASRTYTLPNRNMTVAGVDDISNKLLGIIPYTASTGLNPTDVGKLSYLNANTVQTLFLPPANSVPVSSVFSLINIIGSARWDITTTGGAFVFGMGANNVSSFSLYPQSCIQLTTDGNNWIQVTSSNFSLIGINSTAFTSGINYPAATDGFVFGNILSSGTSMRLQIYSDATATPVALLEDCGTTTTAFNYYIPFHVVIKRKNFWRVDMISGAAPTINFTPLGV